MDERAEAIAKAYAATAQRMPGVSFKTFEKAIEGSDVHPVKVDGDCVGAVVVTGCEVHACVMPCARGRWFGKAQVRILANVLRKYGVAATRATTEPGVEFVRRLGFRQFGNLWLKGL